ncbi:Trm112 family protein [Streptomyces sp. NPDC058646]|uniref:Trm112 family protein n=1 Tax=Streptomyces sp. NPDC058646 TaxID=3346574 RepID=UPI003669AC1F
MPQPTEPDPQLLALLACPVDKGPLIHVPEEDLLYNPRLRRGYPIRDNLPYLRPLDALTLDDIPHQELLSRIEERMSSAS